MFQRLSQTPYRAGVLNGQLCDNFSAASLRNQGAGGVSKPLGFRLAIGGVYGLD